MFNWLTRFWTRNPQATPSELRDWRGAEVDAFLDAFNVKTVPTTAELIKSYVEVVYECATINANAVASVAPKLYVNRSRSGMKLSSGHSRPIDRKTRQYLAAGPARRKAMGDVEEVTEHALLDILDNVSPWFDGFSWLAMTQLYLDITGRCYWLNENGALGEPVSLWVLPTGDVKQVIGDDGLVESYEFTGSQKTIDSDKLCIFRTPALANPYVKDWSPAIAAAQSIGILDADAALVTQLLQNSGRGPMWLTPKDSKTAPGEPETKRMLKRLRSLLRSGGKADFFVTKNSYDSLKMGLTPLEMQQLARTVHHSERIYKAFGVPVAMGTKDTNMANLKAALLQHARFALLPRLTRLYQVLNQQWVPRFGDGLFLWFDSPVPEDVELLSKVRKLSLDSGRETINEQREEDGQEPVAWGEKPWLNKGLLQPSNDAEANERDVTKPPSASPVIAPDAAKPEDDEPPEKTVERDWRDVFEILSRLALCPTERAAAIAKLVSAYGWTAEQAFDMTTRDLAIYLEVSDTCERSAAVTRHGWHLATGKAEGHDRSLPEGNDLATTLRGIFREQLNAILKQFGKSVNAGGAVSAAGVTGKVSVTSPPLDLQAPIDLSAYGWDKKMQFAAQPAIEISYEAGGTDALARLGVGDVFDVKNQLVQEAIDAATLNFCEATNATTSMQLNAAIAKLRADLAAGIISGEMTIPELTKAVGAVFNHAEKYRAERIARTESSRALHDGQVMGAKQSGVVKGFRWLLSYDACPLCIDIEASYPQGVGFGENFGRASEYDSGPTTVSADYDLLPHPPAHPNCQCTITEIIDEGALE